VEARHELRTPLSAIIGYEELLADGITGPVSAAQREQLGRIKASAQHLLGLIEEILVFARIEAGRESVSICPVDVRAVAEEVRGLVAPLAAEKGLALHLRAAERLPAVETDPGKLRQILLNLVGNAVKYTERGEVVAEVRGERDAVTLDVRDSGIGIAPEHLERIFDPFWQADQTATRRAGGTGLGLAVARRLATLLGADLSVESRLGEGTTFTVRVPVRSGE
jgi:signal transduction histidine kinase